jgi:putative sterol carrier protein
MRCCLLLVPLLMLPVLPLEAARPDTAYPATSYSESNPKSPDDVFAQMQHSFRSDRARGQHIRYQFNFSDPHGGKWWLIVNDGTYTMGKGTIPKADVTFACTGDDWVRLSVGSLGGFQAFFTGRLRVSGNQFTAHKLDEMFP